eukprot:scaffold58755_cov34-Tisochrysis_lutea.AAC.2
MGVCGLGALLGVVVLASGPCSPSEGFECLQGIDGLAPESISDGFDSLDGLHGVEGSAADLRPARFMGGRDSREAGFAGVRGFALCGREPTGIQWLSSTAVPRRSLTSIDHVQPTVAVLQHEGPWAAEQGIALAWQATPMTAHLQDTPKRATPVVRSVDALLSRGEIEKALSSALVPECPPSELDGGSGEAID